MICVKDFRVWETRNSRPKCVRKSKYTTRVWFWCKVRHKNSITLYNCKTALHIGKSALLICKTALHLHKTALYICTLYIRKKSHICKDIRKKNMDRHLLACDNFLSYVNLIGYVPTLLLRIC